MKPIVLTKEGETFLVYSGFEKEDKNKILDDSNPVVGIHAICKGSFEAKNISNTHFAIICSECCLRVLIPNSVKTFGQLRRFLKKLQKASR